MKTTKKKEPNLLVAVLITGALVIFVLYLMGVFRSKPAKSQINILKAKEQIIAISSQDSVNEYISIAEVELTQNDSLCRITINLLFEPENHSQIKTWTNAVCEECLMVLKANGIVNKNISGWGQRQMADGRVIIYGRTYYNHYTKKYEFKTARELNLK